MKLRPALAERFRRWLVDDESDAPVVPDVTEPRTGTPIGDFDTETLAHAPSAPDFVGMPATVGGYRVGRSLGAGGMGDVHVAFDERLQRQVALKAIRTDQRLDQQARDRFLREARMLSSLDHPNICVIHDYLESESGDFLVLELIEGETLDASEPRLAYADKLRTAEQIAGVLATAHAAGIVHRDLKPGNVMVTAAGDIKVLDFGLAQFSEAIEPSAGVGAGRPDRGEPLTERMATRSLFVTRQENRAAGTPRYMSPEQARGDAVGPASDLYSFGLVLQELFTGRTAYERVFTLEELLARVRVGQTRPVIGVPRDVRHLIERLKASEASTRPTAAETLARLRWIREKPRRRMRRLVIGAAAILAALAGLKYTVDLRRERAQAITARNDAEGLTNFMVADLGARLEELGRLDVFEEVADQVLEYFARVPDRDLDDTGLHQRGKAFQLLGRVRLGQGDLQSAEDCFDESVTLLNGVVERNPGQQRWLADLGATHFFIGAHRMDRAQLDDAMAAFDEYQAITDRLVEMDGENPEWQLESAYAHQNRGALFLRRGDPDPAAAEFEATIAITRRLLDRDRTDADLQRGLASALSWLGSTRLVSGDVEAALDVRLRELEILRGLAASDPRNAWDQLQLATCHGLLGELRLQREQCPEALPHFVEAHRIVTALVERDPENTGYRRDLAVNHHNTGKAKSCGGALNEARGELRSGHDILAALVEQEPENVAWRRQLVSLQEDLVDVAIREEQWEVAIREADFALDALSPLTEGDRELTTATRTRLARIHDNRGVASRRLGRIPDARAAWEHGLDAIDPAASDSDLPEARVMLAILLLRLDRVEDAAPLIRELEGTAAWTEELAELAETKGVLRAER